MTRNPPKFRIHSKNISLTYPPQCLLSKEEALEQIRNLKFNNSVTLTYLKVERVKADDGQSFYLRCQLQFAKKFFTANSRFFDLISLTNSTNFHPNIEETKSFTKSLNDDDIVKWGEFRPDSRTKVKSGVVINRRGPRAFHVTAKELVSGDGIIVQGDPGYNVEEDKDVVHPRGKNKSSVYAEALKAKNKEAALDVIRRGDPKCFWLNYTRLERNLDLIFKEMGNAAAKK